MKEGNEGSMLPHEARLDGRFYRENDGDRGLRKDVMKEGGINREGQNITEGDLFFIPSEISEEELVGLIVKKFGVKDIKEAIPEISKYFQEAKKFAQDYLLIKLPKEIERTKGKEIENSDHLLKLLRKTRALKSNRPSFLSPYYCALAFIVLAEREFHNAEMQGFVKESEAFYESLFENDSTGTQRFHKTKKAKGSEDYDEIGIYDGRNWIRAKAGFRGKSEESTIAKFIRTPETDVQEMIKDGIGLKFEVRNEEESIYLIEFLSRHFKDEFETESLILENIDFLEKSEEAVLRESTQSLRIKLENESNPTSNKNFKALKLRGKITVKKEGKKDGMQVSRNFEIQIVTENNRNEEGFTRHSVYKGVQKLSAYTRLFGTFPEDYLNLICQEISKNSGIGTDKIKDHILGNFLSVAEYRGHKGNVIRRYGFTKHLERWKKARLLPKGFKYKSSGNGNGKKKN